MPRMSLDFRGHIWTNYKQKSPQLRGLVDSVGVCRMGVAAGIEPWAVFDISVTCDALLLNLCHSMKEWLTVMGFLQVRLSVL